MEKGDHMEKGTLRTCCRSDAGIRMENEDACGVNRFRHPMGTVVLLAVADGLGGHPAGEVASALAVDTIMKVTEERLSLLEDIAVESLKRLLEFAFMEANNVVIATGERDERCRGLGTTLVAALVTESDTCIVGHVGDSRAYLVSRDLHRITCDHSRVQELVDEGILTPAEAECHPMRHIVTRIIGRRGEMPDITICRLDGSRLLLCSDGLLDGMGEPEILTAMQGAGMPEVCDLLVERAREKSRDNITVVVAERKGSNGW